MPLATAPDILLVDGPHQHLATDIEVWRAHDLGQNGPHFVVSYKHVRVGKGVSVTGGQVWAFRSKEQPPEAALQKIVCRSFMIGRTLYDEDVVDLLLPYKFAEVLTK